VALVSFFASAEKEEMLISNGMVIIRCRISDAQRIHSFAQAGKSGLLTLSLCRAAEP
jgi:hypothetical protein